MGAFLLGGSVSVTKTNMTTSTMTIEIMLVARPLRSLPSDIDMKRMLVLLYKLMLSHTSEIAITTSRTTQRVES